MVDQIVNTNVGSIGMYIFRSLRKTEVQIQKKNGEKDRLSALEKVSTAIWIFRFTFEK